MPATPVLVTRGDEWLRIERLNDECLVWSYGHGDTDFGLSIKRLDDFGSQLKEHVERGWVVQSN